MSGVPSAGWREVYESCHVDPDQHEHTDDPAKTGEVPEARDCPRGRSDQRPSRAVTE
jgi:hypothetical protein